MEKRNCFETELRVVLNFKLQTFQGSILKNPMNFKVL